MPGKVFLDRKGQVGQERTGQDMSDKAGSSSDMSGQFVRIRSGGIGTGRDMSWQVGTGRVTS